MQYWDTCTLLKLYVPEPDSAQFAAHVHAPLIFTSELAHWELLRAIVRKEMEQANEIVTTDSHLRAGARAISARWSPPG